ncbi:MAG: HEAT repeat domain-containing protein [Gemmataceae bacterium]|nr:HEAT repeat domain-containing protein [Gemmataceae bacterium]
MANPPLDVGCTMHAGSTSGRNLTRLGRLIVLVLPTVLMVIGSFRTEETTSQMMWLGAAFQVMVFAFFLVTRRTQQGIGPSVAVVYLVGLAWLWLADNKSGDWFFHLAQCILLIVPLVLFAFQMLIDTGAFANRRARVLAERLVHRGEWPVDLTECRTLPEVKALRESLGHDATPALVLLQHPKPQVRMAALGALEFRKSWRAGQAEVVLRYAQKCKEPPLRAAAVTALANLDDRRLVETLSEFMRDPAPEVRRATIEALLWDAEHRWHWVRHSARLAMMDPALQGDGPLAPENIVLSTEAVTDLMAWATEKGCLGVRAALTLAAHYRRALGEQSGSSLVRNLKDDLANAQAPPLLRIELAQLLRTSNELDKNLLDRLIDSVNPGPLRLIAADALLALDRPGMGYNQQALAALREIARLPNREMALTAADVVQRRLGFDLGLALGQPLPPVHSRLAADVTRRLMAWAAQQDHSARQDDAGESETERQTPTDKHDHGSGVFRVSSGHG